MHQKGVRYSPLILGLVFILASCGSQGGSSAPQIPATVASLSSTATPIPVTGGVSPFTYYNVQTRQIRPLVALSMEYSDTLVAAFSTGIDLNAFRSGLAITPSTAVYADYPFIENANSVYKIAAHGGIGIHIRFVPGVTYTVTQPAFGVNIQVATPALSASSIPMPVRQVSNSPYYYGFLNHPWAADGFLGGLIYESFPTKTAVEQAAVDAAHSTLNAIAQSNAGYIRMDFCADQTIGHLAPYPLDQQRWKGYDLIINALAAMNVTVLPEIQQHCAPPYMHADPAGSGSQTMNTPENYAIWASAVANHLKAFPQITRVEFFNEPNLEGGWKPGTLAYMATDGTGAAPFMMQGYAAVKAANPNLMVVAGALAAGGHHVDPRTWLAGAYSAGCHASKCWDELSVHNYRWAAPASATIVNDSHEDNRFDIYKDVQNVAVAHGDAKPKIMLTEWGYSTCATLTVCFDPMVQSLYFAQGMNLALGDPSVDGVTYVNIVNTSNDSPDFFWSSTALIGNGAPKPAFGTFAQFATGSH